METPLQQDQIYAIGLSAWLGLAGLCLFFFRDAAARVASFAFGAVGILCLVAAVFVYSTGGPEFSVLANPAKAYLAKACHDAAETVYPIVNKTVSKLVQKIAKAYHKN